jgi:hypothetical protein
LGECVAHIVRLGGQDTQCGADQGVPASHLGSLQARHWGWQGSGFGSPVCGLGEFGWHPSLTVWLLTVRTSGGWR